MQCSFCATAVELMTFNVYDSLPNVYKGAFKWIMHGVVFMLQIGQFSSSVVDICRMNSQFSSV